LIVDSGKYWSQYWRKLICSWKKRVFNVMDASVGYISTASTCPPLFALFSLFSNLHLQFFADSV